MNYYDLRLKINPEMSDVICDILFNAFDCDGIVTDQVTYRKFQVSETSKDCLRAFIKGDNPDFEKIIKEQKELLLSRGLTEEEIGTWNYKVKPLIFVDWTEKWKEQWKATHITEKVVIVPSWIDYQKRPNEIIIDMDPGTAFGTGLHDTTQLCVKAMLEYFKPGLTMADIGTGSGILAILAKKMGASEVFGCDTYEAAVEVARENAKKNNVDCQFEVGSLEKITKKYDFICVNILHNVIIEMLGDLTNMLNNGGKLVLSGILKELAPEVWTVLKRENLHVVSETDQGLWMAYVVEKLKW